MQDLYLGDNHDITIVNHDLGIRRDALTVTAQSLAIRLKMFLGEWNLNTTLGIPYFEAIIGKKVDNGLISSFFLSEINKDSNVKSVERFDMQFKNRNFTIDFTATLNYGGVMSRTIEIEV